MEIGLDSMVYAQVLWFSCVSTPKWGRTNQWRDVDSKWKLGGFFEIWIPTFQDLPIWETPLALLVRDICRFCHSFRRLPALCKASNRQVSPSSLTSCHVMGQPGYTWAITNTLIPSHYACWLIVRPPEWPINHGIFSSRSHRPVAMP